jgi:hypothetical protein
MRYECHSHGSSISFRTLPRSFCGSPKFRANSGFDPELRRSAFAVHVDMHSRFLKGEEEKPGTAHIFLPTEIKKSVKWIKSHCFEIIAICTASVKICDESYKHERKV